MTSGAGTANPYVGLRPFEREDTLYFFGRREQTAELLEQLYRTHFLAVVGSSGCGKSSLIRAALIPALLGGFLVEDRDKWRIAMMKPGDAPLRNLAVALCAEGDVESLASEVAALKEAILQDHTQAVIDHLVPRLGDETNLLLLIDQFEEIFALRGSDDEERLGRLGREERRHRARRRAEAADFVDLIVELGKRVTLPVYTVLTMRTDFLGDCDLFYGLPEAMNSSRYLVPRLTRQQLRQAIEGPALLSRASIAPRLLDRLLNELGDRSDRLPVLQHALLRTWDVWRRDGADGPIDLEHYEAAGTLEDALSQHADEALREDDLEATARIFQCLTATDPYHRRVRRPSNLSELAAVSGLEARGVEAILERFRAGGRAFLVISEGAAPGDPRVDISHESLIRQWGRLRDWVDEERESRDRFLELVGRARKWAQGEAALLQDPDLQIALDWRKTAQPTAAWADRYRRGEGDFDAAMEYLDRSRAETEAAARRKRRNRDLLAAATAATIFCLTGLTTWALYSRRVAEEAALKARDQARVAVASEWMAKDPTKAALVLLELERPNATAYAVPRMSEALRSAFYSLELRGHEDQVRSAAFSPDGIRIVTASGDGTARVWNVDGAGEPIALEGHEDTVYGAAFSPDGTRIVTASGDKTARVWNVETGEQLYVLRGHEDAAYSAAFSPDGARIVTASTDGTARVCNVDGTGEPIVLRGHTDGVRSAAFSPDGTRIVAASDDNTARVWNADGAGEPIPLEGHQGWVRSAAFSPDGTRIVTASDDNTARVWNVANGDQLFLLQGHQGWVWSATFSPDGKRIVTASWDKTACVWNAASGEELFVLKGHENVVGTAAFSPDGKRIVTASWDNTARVWNANPGEPVVLKGHEDQVRSAAFSPDGARIVTASDDKTAQVWNADGTGEPIVLQGHQGWVWSATFSPDGKRIVTASWDETVRVWNADGTGEPIPLEGHAKRVRSAAFSPDGNRIVTASDDGTARVWNADGTDEPIVLRGHAKRVRSAAFSPDGTRIVTASDDNTARVWNADTGGQLFPFESHEGRVYSAAFSPDGTRIVTASDDATARVWDAETGKAIGEPLLHGDNVKVASAAFNPDGTRIVTASEDGTARVWNVDGGGEPIVFERHKDHPVYSAAFSPDGTRIVTASGDKTLRVWTISAKGLKEKIQGATNVCLAPSFRENSLGETPEEAQRKYKECERSHDRTVRGE